MLTAFMLLSCVYLSTCYDISILPQCRKGQAVAVVTTATAKSGTRNYEVEILFCLSRLYRLDNARCGEVLRLREEILLFNLSYSCCSLFQRLLVDIMTEKLACYCLVGRDTRMTS